MHATARRRTTLGASPGMLTSSQPWHATTLISCSVRALARRSSILKPVGTRADPTAIIRPARRLRPWRAPSSMSCPRACLLDGPRPRALAIACSSVTRRLRMLRCLPPSLLPQPRRARARARLRSPAPSTRGPGAAVVAVMAVAVAAVVMAEAAKAPCRGLARAGVARAPSPLRPSQLARTLTARGRSRCRGGHLTRERTCRMRRCLSPEARFR